MLAEFGDSCEDSIVSCLVEEDSVIRFFVDFSLGPFLHRRSVYLSGDLLGLASGFTSILSLSSLSSSVSFLGHVWI